MQQNASPGCTGSSCGDELEHLRLEQERPIYRPQGRQVPVAPGWVMQTLSTTCKLIGVCPVRP